MCKKVRVFRKSAFVSIICLLAASVAFLSCSNLFDDVTPEHTSPHNSEGNTITLTGIITDVFSGEGAVPESIALLTSASEAVNRSAMPQKPALASVTYEVSAVTVPAGKTSSGTYATSNGVTTISIELAAGYRWAVTVTMKSNDSEVMKDTYTMESALAANSVLSHDFCLKPLTDGTGSINLSLAANSSLNVASVVVKGLGNDKTLSPSDGIFTLNETEVSAGAYDVTFIFNKSDGKFVYFTTQTINVFKNLTTDKWVTSHKDGSGNFYVTSDMVSLFEQTQFFVGSSSYGTAAAGNPGTPYKPIETLKEVLDYIKESGDSTKDYTIHISGTQQNFTYSITNDFNSKMKSLTLCGMTGNTTDILYGTASGTVLAIATTKPVTIKNLKITNGNAGYKGGGIQMSAGTDVTLGTGALITGNRAFQKGGGVYVEGTSSSKAKLTIENGAEISANTLTSDSNGDGGFGLYADYAIISMTGGSICNHDGTGFTNANNAPRGTVRLKNTQFTMTGGKITRNKVQKIGGNLFVDANTQVTIDGGEISYGSIENGTDDSCGAGMWIQGENSSNKGTVTFKSGKIIGNEAKSYLENKPSQGGGVFIYNYGRFIVEGGEISGNSAKKGGAVFVATSGEFKIKGSASIPAGVNGSTGVGKNDVYLDTDAKITVAGALEGTAPVATITPAIPSEELSVVVKDGSNVSDEDFAAACGKIAVSGDGYIIGSDGKLKSGVTASAAASAIESMTTSGTVTIGGAMTSEQLASIKSALTTLKSTSSSTKVSLDLSGVTGIDTIPSEAFRGCSNLESIALPEYVTSIGGSAFRECNTLKTISLPQNLETIGSSAFYGCSVLEEVEIPSKVKTIGEYAFCSNKLQSIHIPASVESIGCGVFASNITLTELTVDPDNNNYVAEDGVIYSKNRDTIICRAAGLTSEFEIPASVTEIKRAAFHATQCTTMTIPATVTKTGEQLFRGSKMQTVKILAPITNAREWFCDCRDLTSVKLPNTIKETGTYLFSSCTSLKSIELPASVEKISAVTFQGCSSLKSITINHSNAALYIDERAFESCNSSLTVYYMGTEEQKNARTITNNSTVLNSANWDYSFVRVNGGTVSGVVSDSAVFITGRTVPISNLYVCDHEVTQAEYQAVMGSNPSHFQGDDYPPAENETQEKRPVENVSWYDALVYCNKRSIAEGFTPCYSIGGSTNPTAWGTVPTSNDDTWNAADCNFDANGYRLPTEAEWEYIARARNTSTTTYSGSNSEDSVAWCVTNNVGGTHEVKKKDPNTIGIFDMSGNVWEWCWDKTNDPITDIAVDTPNTGADSGSHRIARGGAYSTALDRCAVAFRNKEASYNNNEYVGFRVVRTAQ